jgi:large subunit ribosomal protein L18
MSTINIKKRRCKFKINYELPVVLVSRSNKNITAQVLEPVSKKTLFTSNSYKIKGASKIEKSAKVGLEIAKFLNSKKFDRIVFDRNGFVFHGRVKQVAQTLLENNITI